jgi:hypothetical protein
MSEPRTRSRFTWKRIVGYVISAAIVVAIFVWAIPKYADYHDVASAIGTLTPLELWSLVAATIFNLVTYWWANKRRFRGWASGKPRSSRRRRRRSRTRSPPVVRSRSV